MNFSARTRPPRQASLLLCLILGALLVLSACDSILLEDLPPAVPDTPAPAVRPSNSEPEEVLAAFLDAWRNEDFETMYGLLAGRSRELHPQRQFIEKYTAAHSVLRFGGLEYQLKNVEYQGSTAILNYDIQIESPTFGSIADEGRVMRMVQDGGWKIAWSTLDIINGLSARARLDQRADFPPRADIFDRDSQPLASQDSQVYSLYAVKQDMRSIDACLETLAAMTRRQLNTLRSVFADYLGETRFHIAEIDAVLYNRYRADLEENCAIFPSEGPFSKVRQYRARSYYGHGIATHAVGFIGAVPADELERWEALGYAAGDQIGRAGIERSYQATLAGRPQRLLRIVEGGNTLIREMAGAEGEDPQPVSTTIDRRLQEITAQTMADAVNYALINWGGITAGGAIVAMDVNSGEVLALASYPSFDPQIFNPDTEYNVARSVARLNADIRNPFANKALAEQYTPGSVYKIVTALAAASEGVWTRDEVFDCDYFWYGGDYGDSEPRRTDWRLLEPGPPPPTGPVTITQALAASCNPFFYEMGALMFDARPDMQTAYANLLGFGQATGLRGLGIEAAGETALPNEPAAAINNAIGQGNVAVTALQMAQLTALVANGGTLWQPYIVSHIGSPGQPGYQIENEPTVAADLDLDPEALDIARDGMCLVTTVRDLGTAERVFRDADYSVCGKTGTAETLGNPHAWFVAFWPAEEPEIAFAGVMAHSREGSEVVAPMIRRILDDYLGRARKDFPEWWQEPYIPVKTQAQALQELEEEA